MSNELKAKILALPIVTPGWIKQAIQRDRFARGFLKGLDASAELVSAERPNQDALSLIANLAAVVRVQNGNRHEDVNALLRHADRLLSAPSAEQAAPKCACGLPTCVEPWEPGCGLGQSEEHACVVPEQAEAAPYAGRVPAAWEVRLENYNGDAYTKAITFDGAEAKDWEVKGAKIVPVFYDFSAAPVAQAHTAKGLYFDEHQEALNEAAAQPVEPQADAKEGGK